MPTNSKIVLKTRSGDYLYPRASLDNLVMSMGDTATVQIPVLDASGHIESQYIPVELQLLDSTGHISSEYLPEGAMGGDGVLQLSVSGVTLQSGKFASVYGGHCYCEVASGVVLDTFEQPSETTGIVRVYSGGTIASLNMQIGGIVVYSGGIIEDLDYNPITVPLQVVSDGSVLHTNVSGVYYGKKATWSTSGYSPYFSYTSGTVIEAGTLSVSSITLSSTGYTLDVYNGGTAFRTTVESGAVTVYSGGSVNSITVGRSSAYLYVSSGGTALNIKEAGGYVFVDDDCTATFVANTMTGLTFYGGPAVTVHANTILSGCSGSGHPIYVYSGGIVRGLTMSGGTIEVFAGGRVSTVSALSATYSSYIPSVYVHSGGTLAGLTYAAQAYPLYGITQEYGGLLTGLNIPTGQTSRVTMHVAIGGGGGIQGTIRGSAFDFRASTNLTKLLPVRSDDVVVYSIKSGGTITGYYSCAFGTSRGNQWSTWNDSLYPGGNGGSAGGFGISANGGVCISGCTCYRNGALKATDITADGAGLVIREGARLYLKGGDPMPFIDSITIQGAGTGWADTSSMCASDHIDHVSVNSLLVSLGSGESIGSGAKIDKLRITNGACIVSGNNTIVSSADLVLQATSITGTNMYVISSAVVSAAKLQGDRTDCMVGVSSGGTIYTVEQSCGNCSVNSGYIKDLNIIGSSANVTVVQNGIIDNVSVASKATIKVGIISASTFGGLAKTSGGTIGSLSLRNGGLLQVCDGTVNDVDYDPTKTTVRWLDPQNITFASGSNPPSGAMVLDDAATGVELISSGALVTGVTLANGGAVTVIGQGTATTISCAASKNLYVTVIGSGATATGVSTTSGGICDVWINDGGTLSACTFRTGGANILCNNGIMRNINIPISGKILAINASCYSISGGAAFPNGYKAVIVGGILSGGSPGPYGSVCLQSGARLIGVNLYSASAYISSGCTGSTIIVDKAGSLCVSSGGTSLRDIVSASGRCYASEGGLLSGTTVLSGGTCIVSSGGTAKGITVMTGGTLTLMDGAIQL